MFICPICNKEFNSKLKLGGHSSAHRKTPQRLAYEANPHHCKRCNKEIPYVQYVERKKIQFCSNSCRAKTFYKIKSF